jgi:hypothetical protein
MSHHAKAGRRRGSGDAMRIIAGDVLRLESGDATSTIAGM